MGCVSPAERMKNSVAGSYEAKIDSEGLFNGATFKLVLLENGKGELYVDGSKGEGDKTWKIAGKEVHFGIEKGADSRGGWAVFKIESNGELSWLGEINGGKRTDFPKEEQPPTFKKIKQHQPSKLD